MESGSSEGALPPALPAPASVQGKASAQPLSTPASAAQLTQRSAVAVSPAPAVVSSAPTEDLYDYEKCTVVLVVQFRPAPAPGQPRPVLVSVQNGATNKQELPLLHLYADGNLGGPLPPTLLQQLGMLRAQLPERKQQHDRRSTVKATTPSSSGQRPGAVHKQKKVKGGASVVQSQTIPAVPTASSPMPAGHALELGSIFDEL